MAYEFIKLAVADGVATLTLNRGEVLVRICRIHVSTTGLLQRSDHVSHRSLVVRPGQSRTGRLGDADQQVDKGPRIHEGVNDRLLQGHYRIAWSGIRNVQAPVLESDMSR